MVRARTHLPTCKDNKKKLHIKTFILTIFQVTSHIPSPPLNYTLSSSLSPHFSPPYHGFSAAPGLLGICQATKRSPKAIREAGGGDNSSPIIGEVSKGQRGSKIINNNFSIFIPFIFLYKYSQCVHPISS